MMELDGGAGGWGARQRDKGPPRRSWLVSAHPGASAVPVTPAAQRPGGRALYETVNNAEGRPDDKSDVHQSERQMGCGVDAVPHRGGRASPSVVVFARPPPPVACQRQRLQHEICLPHEPLWTQGSPARLQLSLCLVSALTWPPYTRPRRPVIHAGGLHRAACG